MRPSDEKLKALILYIARECESDPGFGKVKLNKLLFYADFTAFAETGEPITGQPYKKYPQGPVAPKVQELLDEMVYEGLIGVESREFHSREQMRVTLLQDPDLGILTERDREFADHFIRKHWGKTGRQISELSHEFVGWRVTEIGEIIPYPMMLLDVGPLTAAEEALVAREAALYEASLP
jgi:hypothetical protein